MKRIKLEITGIVQGVGFRPFVYNLAKSLNLTGFIFNHSEGVTIEAQGETDKLNKFFKLIKGKAPKAAKIETVNSQQITVNRKDIEFKIKKSKKTLGYQSVSPDLAICENCKKELFNKNDRRFLYPFINCTNCGPRFTIISQMPYDRPNTVMKKFKMCSNCQKEYNNPVDRRFHAQPVSCQECGPVVQGTTDNRKQLTVNSENKTIKKAARVIERGGIVTLKGLGGFHLICDATNKKAIEKLRERKNRPEKPFALMMDSIKTIKKYCQFSKKEEELLKSPKSPIVLLKKRLDIPEIAPGLNRLGVMLPYTPLHLLLYYYLKKPIPLVCTSGNLSEEPIITENKEAIKKLKKIADYFLLHNRDILTGYDDSIIKIINSKSQPLNKSQIQIIRTGKGIAPVVIQLPFKAKKEITAFGGDLKNTFCIVRENKAFVSQYLGDLENLESSERFQKVLENYKKIFRVNPKIIVSDIHPGYFSTKLAGQLSAINYQLFKLQHHKAHIASVIAENNIKGKVIGVSFDGTGFGDDRKIWGGEFFLGDLKKLKRVAHIKNFILPGGDLAAKEPWRVVIAILAEVKIKKEKVKNILRGISSRNIDIVLKQIKANINCVESSSMGRLFDAVSSILGVVQENTYEGEAAMKLESLISENKTQSQYNFKILEEKENYIIDWQPVICEILKDLKEKTKKEIISAKFHNGVSKMILEICLKIKKTKKINSVCLSGGVFQNNYLLEKTMLELEKRNFKVFINKKVPINDSGISLGQAAIQAFKIKEKL